MSLFGRKEKQQIQILQKQLLAANKRNRQLESLCAEKDSFFKEMIADGLRHKSPLAAKHMADRKKFLNGK